MADHRPGLLLGPLPEVLQSLGTSANGLTRADAEARLVEHGPNELVARAGPGFLSALGRQLTHPLALLLWLAAALSGYLPPQAVVVRDGRRTSVEARTIVPGDVIVVEEGDAVCADAKILTGAVEVDLSTVTGESVPVVRSAAPAGPPGRRLVDARDVLLSGTTCTTGECAAVVAETGMGTELGRIAGLSGRTTQEPSPLERQVRRVAWLIAAVAFGVALAFLPPGVCA